MGHLICQNFEGAPSKVIPQIYKKGYELFSTKELLEKRLEIYSSNSSEIDFWIQTPMITKDICIYHKNGGMKLVKDTSQIIKLLSDFDSLGLVHPDPYTDKNSKVFAKIFEEMYNKSEGVEFSKKDDKKHATRRLLEHDDIIKNPYWLALSDNNKDLLSEYSKMLISISKKMKSDRAMGVIAMNPIKPLFDIRISKLHGIYTTNLGLVYDSDIELEHRIDLSKETIFVYNSRKTT